jgi:hypothetical protein
MNSLYLLNLIIILKKKNLNLGSVQKLFILPEIFYYWIILIKVVRSKVGKTK